MATTTTTSSTSTSSARTRSSCEIDYFVNTINLGYGNYYYYVDGIIVCTIRVKDYQTTQCLVTMQDKGASL